ncbi:hypothetical protein BX257_4047 [Streptomyces sp. 3212.3]|uniref:hypothetical protein n=1 Tax=Streptomyces sp. 3212.3 TaxID=1938846 RepID=UPI000E2469D8|nr:hypothetical protein [Streptomyces sp. 3212.3]REE61468.1 hypothetical protein BX257_4047 [Streptomyces sp. 3212.3]
MPHPTTRPLRKALKPLIAGAVLASAHPGLEADSIEIDHDTSGLRVFLYHPAPGVLEQWANAIEAPRLGVATPTSRKGETSRHITGRVGTTPVEVTCVSLHSEWVWRTSAGRSTHKRHPANPDTARCDRPIVGVADRTHWDLPGYRCADCVRADEEPGGAQ